MRYPSFMAMHWLITEIGPCCVYIFCSVYLPIVLWIPTMPSWKDLYEDIYSPGRKHTSPLCCPSASQTHIVLSAEKCNIKTNYVIFTSKLWPVLVLPLVLSPCCQSALFCLWYLVRSAALKLLSASRIPHSHQDVRGAWRVFERRWCCAVLNCRMD